MDLLLLILPKILPDGPTVGPAVLKAHAEAAGFSARVIDFNIALYNSLKITDEHHHYFFDSDMLFRTHLHDGLNRDFAKFAEEKKWIFDSWMEQLKAASPKFIGLSLLSNWSTSVAVYLAGRIREEMPDVKLIWGGAVMDRFASKYHEAGLADYWVWGDGEEAIVHILKGEVDRPGINYNGSTQVLDLDSVMMPDYSDIDFDAYDMLDSDRPVYITGSRGCVKRCTFCNVYDIWPQYVFRSGDHLAREIIEVNSKWDRRTFKFTDSLINGSMKNFRDALQTVADYKQTSGADVKWHSQWIIRSPRQSPESDYELMKASGCKSLDVGIESFSQSVRWHMGKKFTDDDMFFCLEMLNKYRIHHSLLMIVGYPTETEADHQRTLEVLDIMRERGWTNNGLVYFSFANTLMLDPGQTLWEQVKDGLTLYNNEWDWTYGDNDIDTRIRRFREVNEKAAEVNGQAMTWMSKKKLKIIESKRGVKEDVANVWLPRDKR